MQAMLLIYSDEKAWAARSQEEKGAIYGAYMAYTAALKEAGALISGDPLQPSMTAHTVRVAAGAPQVLDGPYAETKEQLAGYYLIEVEDMQAALRWAARCPGATHGVMEVRPVMVMGPPPG
ncbi:hypothetical protein DFH01_00995 [Falsiroseomonas bella]|uniref:YCII-related domain-containing protein n=1 Tax=Falsiroseomonas bella TaxID=2184016 RepID=A0A317FFR7_9PROT|nr:YciI family protein [Falsiroseomonas bella]PWS37924.1 hypothetical protein DFH01_00995 [Falsiroseomonas bella]